MLERDQLLAWKKQYGTVFHGFLADREYCFRPLTIGEFNAALGGRGAEDLGLAEQVEAEDEIVGACLLYPDIEEYGSWPVGLAATLAETIISASGWGEEDRIEEIFSQCQRSLNTYVAQFKLLIITAEMGYSWEELDNVSMEKMVELAAAANAIVSMKGQIAMGNPPQLTLGGEEEGDPTARMLHQAARKEGIM